MKFVKPSELNLDFINPNLKGGKGGSTGLNHNYIGGGPATSNNQMSSNNNV